MSALLLEPLALPVFSDDLGDKAPQFNSLETCKAWVSALAITNVPQSLLRLRYQLDSFNRLALPSDVFGADRLAILDHLRGPILFVQGECAKRFALQRFALPLAGEEQTVFDAEQALWRALETGYLQILQCLLKRAAVAPLNEAERHTAVRAARHALTTARSACLAHYQAGLLPPASFWQRLHHAYMAAEELHIHALIADNKSPAGAIYADVLLLSAARPYRFSAKHLEQVAYWAQRWAIKVPLLPQLPEDDRTPPLSVDLSGSQPATHVATATATASPHHRWCDLRELRKTIKQRLAKLGEGVSPQELKLGKHCTQPDCERLLVQVYRDWCKGGAVATPAAAGTVVSCELVSGIEAIHAHLGGRRIQTPHASLYLSKRSHEEIATFGHVTRHAGGEAAPVLKYDIEHWQVLNENLREIEMQRPLDAPGQPLRAGQLVVIRHSVDGQADLQLAQVHWAMPALNQPATLLVPTGWFGADRVIEVHDDPASDDVWQSRLTQRLERGTDFERCACE